MMSLILKMNDAVVFAGHLLECDIKTFDFYACRARELTNIHYGNKRMFFNPIYLSNVCNCDCCYCGYRRSNNDAVRKTLTPDESLQEALYLKDRGINNILFLAGEYGHDEYVKMLEDNIAIINNVVKPKWTGVEVAALKKKAYVKLREKGVKSVILFQETYDLKKYQKLHVYGVKSDYYYRLYSQYRAASAGIEEVGLGVLYGINNWFCDTMAMIKHGLSIKEKYPKIKLRFSFPRLMKSKGFYDYKSSYRVDDATLYRIIITIRNCFPDSSLVITGRESAKYIMKVIDVVNVVGKGGKTSVGGYNLKKHELEQFNLIEGEDLKIFFDKVSEKYEIC